MRALGVRQVDRTAPGRGFGAPVLPRNRARTRQPRRPGRGRPGNVGDRPAGGFAIPESAHPVLQRRLHWGGRIRPGERGLAPGGHPPARRRHFRGAGHERLGGARPLPPFGRGAAEGGVRESLGSAPRESAVGRADEQPRSAGGGGHGGIRGAREGGGVRGAGRRAPPIVVDGDRRQVRAHGSRARGPRVGRRRVRRPQCGGGAPHGAADAQCRRGAPRRSSSRPRSAQRGSAHARGARRRRGASPCASGSEPSCAARTRICARGRCAP